MRISRSLSQNQIYKPFAIYLTCCNFYLHLINNKSTHF
nr:MAG TPA: hypothetical protein [Caudoviricetes sp.]